jgi:serpin B
MRGGAAPRAQAAVALAMALAGSGCHPAQAAAQSDAAAVSVVAAPVDTPPEVSSAAAEGGEDDAETVADPEPADAAPATRAAVADAVDAFGFDLYRAVASAKENVIVSPVSVAFALAMAMEGARGETRRQMTRALHVDGLAQPAGALGRLFATLQSAGHSPGVAVHVADRVYVAERLPVDDGFLARVAGDFGAAPERIDFEGDPDAARQTINAWVARQTADRIRALLPANAVDPMTRLVLVDAVYFRAAWTQPFIAAATHDRPFAAPGGRVSVKTMATFARLRYAKLPGLALVELPYVGSMTMVVALPDDPNGLAGLEDRMATEHRAWIRALSSRDVAVELPAWQGDWHAALGRALASLGITRAFADAADFTGISPSPTRIADVFHRAWVRVDERGTEAAAATATVMTRACALPPPPVYVYFRADHPFVYLLRESKTGVILFMGRVVDPRSTAAE